MKRIYKSGATKFIKNRLPHKKWGEILKDGTFMNDLIQKFCAKYSLIDGEKFELEGRGLFGYHPIYEDTPKSFICFTITIFR